ncbi:Cyanate hydratase [Termitomyces sp. T112]|nr:Cyanate hydratase [Termitomyces sp. T112]
MDTKLSVIKELSEKAKAKPVEPVIEEPLVVLSPEPALPLAALESIFEDAYTLPDTFIDDLWEQMSSASDHFAASPSPSTSTTDSTSTASSLSVSTPPAFKFACYCPALERDVSTSWFDLWDNETADDQFKNGNFQPFATRNECRGAPRKKSVNKQIVQCQQVLTPMDLFSVPLPDSPVLKTKQKRRTPASTYDAKRQKVDAEVVCRINGCRHISKTRFECFKHRETHFPGRFQCPHPSCLKVFVRSSSLARHLKRPRNVECRSYAGSQSEWGIGLINFALRPPPWLEPGFLDEISEL